MRLLLSVGKPVYTASSLRRTQVAWQTGTVTLERIREILRQASELGTVEWFYFEGGELFLFYPIMVRGVEEAAALGFKVGIVTNGYWGTDLADSRD
jgi:pyruvate-formate lyase-activating enzyme